MWTNEVLPQLTLPESALFTRIFKTNGIGESTLAEKLGDLTLQSNPSVATYAKLDGVHVRVAAKGSSQSEAETIAKPALERVETILSKYIWGTDDDSLPDLVHAKLRAQGRSVASLESLSSGMLAQTLGASRDAPLGYRGGVVAWSMQTMLAYGLSETLLGSSFEDDLEKLTLMMAEAVARLHQADYGLAIHSHSSTEPAASRERSEDEATIQVHIAVHGPDERVVRSFKLPPLGRRWLHERSTYAALFLLLSQLSA